MRNKPKLPFAYGYPNPKDTVCAITATKGRHSLLERAVGMFMEQDYGGFMLIFNNSEVPQSLMEQGRTTYYFGDKAVILVNHPLDSRTGKPYTNLGAIYNDALYFVPKQCGVIVHWDDDDVYLQNHISEGLNGLDRARIYREIEDAKTKLIEGEVNPYTYGVGYKPEKSYFRSVEGISTVQNNLEPSIFVDRDVIDFYKYSETTTEQHLQWLNYLKEKDLLYVDPNGQPTLVYNWGDGAEFPTWKTSGDPGNPLNFQNYTNFSQDHGDRIITPWSARKLKKYYDQIKEFNGQLT